MRLNPNDESMPVCRQGMFDDTYVHIPTQGWMFVPLTVYHSGGDAAQFEPLVAHQIEYEWALAQYLGSFLAPLCTPAYPKSGLGAGVAACYRGYRLYDTNETKALVTKWVAFYKKYRPILIRDIVHVGRCHRFVSLPLCPSPPPRFVEQTCNRSTATCTLTRMPKISKVTHRRLSPA